MKGVVLGQPCPVIYCKDGNRYGWLAGHRWTLYRCPVSSILLLTTHYPLLHYPLPTTQYPVSSTTQITPTVTEQIYWKRTHIYLFIYANATTVQIKYICVVSHRVGKENLDFSPIMLTLTFLRSSFRPRVSPTFPVPVSPDLGLSLRADTLRHIHSAYVAACFEWSMENTFQYLFSLVIHIHTGKNKKCKKYACCLHVIDISLRIL